MAKESVMEKMCLFHKCLMVTNTRQIKLWSGTEIGHLCKGPDGENLGFAGHIVSIAMTQLCCYSGTVS